MVLFRVNHIDKHTIIRIFAALLVGPRVDIPEILLGTTFQNSWGLLVKLLLTPENNFFFLNVRSHFK